MTIIPAISQPPVAGAAGAAASSLASNFDTFLTLLTAQLKNQDPLSPMESNEFTQQLVQFSQVEQQISANKNLENLIGLTRARAGIDSISYLGKTLALTNGFAALDDGAANWTYTLNGQASVTSLSIADVTGKTVWTGTGGTANGDNSFVWDGKDNMGNALPDGAYHLTVRAKLADGSTVPSAVESRGIVTEIDLTGGEPVLMIGSMGVPLSQAALVSGS